MWKVAGSVTEQEVDSPYCNLFVIFLSMSRQYHILPCYFQSIIHESSCTVENPETQTEYSLLSPVCLVFTVKFKMRHEPPLDAVCTGECKIKANKRTEAFVIIPDEIVRRLLWFVIRECRGSAVSSGRHLLDSWMLSHYDKTCCL
jgi:hypothetical protein